MNKNTFLYIVVIVILLLGGYMLYVQQKNAQELQEFQNRLSSVCLGDKAASQECKGLLQQYYERFPDENPNAIGGPGKPTPITVQGEITCLPKKGSGAQTLECAIGLMGQDGKYYGLRNLPDFDPEYKFSQTGMKVEVAGTFTSGTMEGPGGSTYDVVGNIEVTSIKEVTP